MQCPAATIHTESIVNDIATYRHMVCLLCKHLAVGAPMLSCGARVCRLCCVTLVLHKEEKEKDSSVASSSKVSMLQTDMSLHDCPCGNTKSEEPCKIEAPVDKSLVRCIQETLQWSCVCGATPFTRLDTYETHLRESCPDRHVTCKWCTKVSPAKEEHEENCMQRRVTCDTCDVDILWDEQAVHKIRLKKPDGTLEMGCINATRCEACTIWFKGTSTEAITAHTTTCARQIVKCGTCGHECLRHCLETHRDSDIVCLRGVKIHTRSQPLLIFSPSTPTRYAVGCF
jgi:hypothetical protein